MQEFTLQDSKNWPTNIGVYGIYFKNSEKKKFYIGSAASTRKNRSGFKARWMVHINCLKRKSHHSKKLQNAYNKYGKENLVFFIIEECNLDILYDREGFYINQYNSFKNGYNCTEYANSVLGHKQTQESINKMIETKENNLRKNFPKIAELYNQGKTYRQIQEETGFSPSTICKALKFSNIKIKNRATYSSQKVFAYNLSGDLLGHWDSVLECSKYFNVPDRSVWKVLSGGCKTLHDIIYSKVELTYEDINEIKKRKIVKQADWAKIARSEKMKKESKDLGKFVTQWIEVKQIDKKTGEIIKIWNKMSDVTTFYELKNAGPILKCLGKSNRSYKGFRWEARLVTWAEYQKEQNEKRN
jgi:group I intron endonuclease